MVDTRCVKVDTLILSFSYCFLRYIYSPELLSAGGIASQPYISRARKKTAHAKNRTGS